MGIPLISYFAGIGTVTAALGIGFAGAVALMDAKAPPKIPAAAFGLPALPAPKEEEPPVPPPAPHDEVAIIEFLNPNPVFAAESMLKTLVSAPPATAALQEPGEAKQDVPKLASPRKAHRQPKHETKGAVQRKHMEVAVRRRTFVPQQSAERPRVIAERLQRVVDAPRVTAYVPVARQEPDFFRALFGL